jgi:hypothetical protein
MEPEKNQTMPSDTRHSIEKTSQYLRTRRRHAEKVRINLAALHWQPDNVQRIERCNAPNAEKYKLRRHTRAPITTATSESRKPPATENKPHIIS